MHLIWIIVLLLVYYSSSEEDELQYPARTPPPISTQAPPLMWFGVLIYQKTSSSQEYITGITLIKKNLGVVNANDVARIPKRNIRGTTRAMFLQRETVVRSVRVADYVLHPEYNQHTLNTLALVQLERDETMFNWEQVYWPKKNELMNEQVGVYYAVRYTDVNETLEQQLQAMDYVDLSECIAFFQQAQLDKQWLSPLHYECFKQTSSEKPCVYDSGMALAVYRGGKWKLLGISVLGPGCALPSRFIDFARYVPWVQHWVEQDARAHSPRKTGLPKIKGWMYNKVIIQGADVKINSRRILRSV